MKYYGSNRLFFNYIIYKKRKNNYFYNILGLRQKLRFNLNRRIDSLYIPFVWEFLILKNVETEKRFLYFYSTTYFFKIPLPKTIDKVYYFCSTRTIHFFYTIVYNFSNFFWLYLKQLFRGFLIFFFKKLKFRGKGYYIFKNKRNTVTFRFGYSHRIYLYFYGSFVKFLSKTSIFIFGINKFEIINYGNTLKNVRPYNLFTGKGVRFTRQIIYKKIGKVGSYR